MNGMTAAVWTGARDLQVGTVEAPEVPAGWAVVEVAYNGICGTDLSILRGAHPRAAAPLILGHEIAGWVERPGDSGPDAGALVAVEPLITCGRCWACRTGHRHVCRRLGLYGIDAPGGMAQYVALPPQALHPVPAHVDPRTATLAEPLAVAVHAVRQSGMRPGDTVAVLGAGPIGVLTALVARHEGAGSVVIDEPRQWRRQAAGALGLEVVPEGATMTEVLEAPTGGEGADVTFDSAAHPAVAAQLSNVTRVRGRIVVVGVYKKPTEVDLQAVCFKEQTMVGVRVYTSADMAQAVELIASAALPLGDFPTRALHLTEANRAAAAAAGGEDCLKVLVTPVDGREDA